MASAIDPTVIGAGNIDKASVRLQLERARDEITALEASRLRIDGTLSMSGDLVVAKVGPSLLLRKTASGQAATIFGTLNSSVRWAVTLGDTAAETGSNAGSSFSIGRFSDAGTFIDSPLSFARANGAPVVASPALWRTGLGATTTGDALFTATDAAAGRTALGATTVGNSLFTATDAASGRTTLNTPPLPTVSAGVGQWVAITTDGSGNYTLPAGGTWAYFWSNILATVSISPGGTQIITGDQPTISRGFAWRIA